jgi:hypothetical protein
MATYYWVGGNGTWDNVTTTNWSLTSGGSGGAGVPTSADDVVVDSSSGSLGNTITIFTGAEAKSLTYTGGVMNFSGVGSGLLLYGSFQILAALPSGTFNVDTVEIRVSTLSGTVVSNASLMRDLVLTNWISSQAIVSINSNIQCALFRSVSVSLTTVSSSITCTQFLLEGGPANLYAKTVSNLSVTITQLIPIGGNQLSCNWTGSLAAFNNVSVLVKDSVGTVTLDTDQQASYATSFNLSVDNSTCNIYIRGGVNNLTILNSGNVDSRNLPVFGNILVNSGCQLSAVFSSDVIEFRKKTGSPNVTRTITAGASSSWLDLGFINYVAASTDTVNFDANIGTAISSIKPDTVNFGIASVGAVTVYALAISLATGSSFSSTILHVESNFTVPASASISGSYTINSYGALINTNGVTVPNLIVRSWPSASRIFTNLVVNNFSILAQAAQGPARVEVQPTRSITISGNFVLTGLSFSDYVELTSYSTFVTPAVFNLTKSSGIVNAVFATIGYSNATGGAIFYALESNGCIDSGNNSGWIFKATSGNFFLFL